MIPNLSTSPSTTLAEFCELVQADGLCSEGNGLAASAPGDQGWLGGLLAGWVEVAARRLFFFRPA